MIDFFVIVFHFVADHEGDWLARCIVATWEEPALHFRYLFTVRETLLDHGRQP